MEALQILTTLLAQIKQLASSKSLLLELQQQLTL